MLRNDVAVRCFYSTARTKKQLSVASAGKGVGSVPRATHLAPRTAPNRAVVSTLHILKERELSQLHLLMPYS